VKTPLFTGLVLPCFTGARRRLLPSNLPHTIDNMRWNEGLAPEPALPEAINEALDVLKIGGSHSIAEWLRQHRPRVYERESRSALERRIAELRNERAVSGR
jgi:hypothetical protein